MITAMAFKHTDIHTLDYNHQHTSNLFEEGTAPDVETVLCGGNN